MSKSVYAQIREYPITARIGTRQEFIELRDKAMSLDHELVVSYSNSSYWFLKAGIKWTEILPGSTLAYLLEKLEREYPQQNSVRVMLTSTDAAFFIAGSVPGYRYICTAEELMKLYDSVPPGMIELDPLGDGVGNIDMRRATGAYPNHPVVKEFTESYAMAELTEQSSRANNHIMFFEFI